MPSTVIRHVHYKPELKELSVWFAGSGERYKYFDVPGEVASSFTYAPSRGRYFNEHIRGHYRCRLVADPRAPRRFRPRPEFDQPIGIAS